MPQEKQKQKISSTQVDTKMILYSNLKHNRRNLSYIKEILIIF